MINGYKEGEPWTEEELSTSVNATEFENSLKSIYAKKLRVINSVDRSIKETLKIKPILVDM
jgi:hypothetical protein